MIFSHSYIFLSFFLRFFLCLFLFFLLPSFIRCGHRAKVNVFTVSLTMCNAQTAFTLTCQNEVTLALQLQ
jgi:hypothetical protein